MRKVFDITVAEIGQLSRYDGGYAIEVLQQHQDRLRCLDAVLNLITDTDSMQQEVVDAEFCSVDEPPRPDETLFNDTNDNRLALAKLKDLELPYSPMKPGGMLSGASYVVSKRDNQLEACQLLDTAGATKIAVLECGDHPLELDSEHRCRTPNPWNFEKVAGGCSGTVAAAVAAGGAGFSVAADHCGSLILSANFCGTVALRPTSTLSTHGWHTRSVDDAKLIFETASSVRAIHSIHNPVVWTFPDVSPYRLSKTITNMLTMVEGDLGQRGFAIERLQLPLFQQAFAMWVVQCEQLLTDSSMLPTDRPSAALVSMMLDRLFVLQPELGEALKEAAEELRSSLIQLLDGDGVLLLPAYTSTAPYATQSGVTPMDFVFSAIFAAMDLPALHVPIGFDTDSTPLGVQLVAAPCNEGLLFHVGHALEHQYRGWVRAQPFNICL